MNRHYEKFSQIIYAVGAILPLFFLPITQDFYFTSQWHLLIFLALFLLVIYSLISITAKKIILNFNPLALSLLIIFLISLISLIFVSPNKVEALLSPFGAGTFLALLIFSVFPTNLESVKRPVWLLLILSSVILSLITLAQYTNLTRFFLGIFPFLSDQRFTPTGSPVYTLLILLITLPLTFEFLRLGKITKNLKANLPVITAIVTIICGIILELKLVLALWPADILPLNFAWSIALEIFKNPKYLLLGVGTEQFGFAFTFAKPLIINQTPLWNQNFNESASFALQLMTTLGICGLIGLLILMKSAIAAVIKNIKTHPWCAVSLIFSLLALIFLPPNLPVFIVFIFVLLLSQPNRIITYKPPDFIPLALSVILILSGLIGLLILGRNWLSETNFYRSLIAAQNLDGTKTYSLQISAIKLNPYISRYRYSFSRTNLILAQALISNKDLQNSPELTNNVQALILQAIREAKITVQLSPFSSSSWQNLGSMYETLIPNAKGADTWAIASFQKAITVDPINPVLRVNLGGVYVILKKYPEAQTAFNQAVSLKPDYANAYYNLANLARVEGDNKTALLYLQKTLTLTPANSSDQEKVRQEITNLNQAAPQKGINLNPNPAPLNFGIIDVPPLDLTK